MKKLIFVFVFILLALNLFSQNGKIDVPGVTEQNKTIKSQEKAPEAVVKNKAKLNAILKKAGEYCEKVKRAALDYVCLENITDKIFYYKTGTSRSVVGTGDVETGIPDTGSANLRGFSVSEFAERKKLTLKRTKRNAYKYDYQLTKKEGKFEEKRVLLKKNAKKKNQKNAELEIRYKASSLIFGPVGFLSNYWQRYFDYEIEGQELLDGKETIVIKASPTERNKDNRNFAKIWVDKEDFSILQIEWEPQSIVGYTEKKKESEVGKLKTNVIWRVTYGVMKNGIRFPSKQHIQEVYVGFKGKKYPIEEISFIYDNYKFFTVETKVKY